MGTKYKWIRSWTIISFIESQHESTNWIEEQVALENIWIWWGLNIHQYPQHIHDFWGQKDEEKNGSPGIRWFPRSIIHLSPEQTKHWQACMLCIELNELMRYNITGNKKNGIKALNNVPGLNPSSAWSWKPKKKKKKKKIFLHIQIKRYIHRPNRSIASSRSGRVERERRRYTLIV